MSTHSSVLAWRIPGMGEPGGLPSMGSHDVRHDWRDLAAAATAFIRISISLHPHQQCWLLPLLFLIAILTPESVSQLVSSVSQSCLTLCHLMDCSTPGLPVHHQLLEFTQVHAHWVGDVIQPSQTLSSPSPPAFNLSQHQSLFKWGSSSHQVAKVLEFQLQHQSFQWIFRTSLL